MDPIKHGDMGYIMPAMLVLLEFFFSYLFLSSFWGQCGRKHVHPSLTPLKLASLYL